MGIASNALYFLFHPFQLRSIIQWKVWHNPVHERDEKNETETLKKCFEFLDLTSRSFSAVIKELHPELLVPVCIFYLTLRGLDTIEDDTSIPLKTKEPLLRNFQDFLEKDGWTFNGNRPEEKDRELLVQFNNVITEFKKLKPAYKAIIKDITEKMGNGMADYCSKAESGDASVKTVEAYDLYCYYVAGLVGDGLTRLFVEAKFGNPALLKRPDLHKSMGLFLQKTNIIRDVREDFDDNRRFWPTEIWSKHVDQFEDLFKPEHREAALNCSSEMVLNALEHVNECLFYLAGLREQSVFNFCAIPQSMAIATLELCFRNPVMFERNIKITKGDACQLMIESTQNLQVVSVAFRRYIRRIHKKNTPKDPNFLRISIVCGQIEKWIETLFPSQTAEEAQRRVKGQKSEADEAAAKESAEARSDVFFVLFVNLIILAFITSIMVGLAWYMGARFDLVWQELKNGHFLPPKQIGHEEL
ncbi:bifunctional farnesyl-diphosphate farnesyltransferase/squalene synthase [Monascus purpureus]|uniref:Squalene synthase n=1 Tax=Monascus purpureus TaxID=5098 RepID=A0A507QL77_MONPU|nr:bifunctional farnesyl-diphosphate farnesyltransferase/squalene synthase [Monascus purpureus]BDD60305.1 Delta(24)-sterol C-methyltransferase [Monascus purpureus]